MLEKVRQYIKHNSLIDNNQPVLVALSGGRDSVALLSILCELQCEAIAIHCNFHLRNKESDTDEQFVKNLCKKNNVQLIVRHFDTINYAKDNGISIEMAARELRYYWFEIVRQKLNAQAIAVAHHQDDQAETLMLNLIRGTGLRGLCGMRNRNGHIIRPLLCVSRQEIEQYISENRLEYVNDSTNTDTTFKRNKIRHDIIPILQSINPNIIETFSREADIFQNTCNLLDYFIDREKKTFCTTTDDYLTIDILKLKAHPMAQELLYHIIRDYGFNAEQCNLIFNNLDSQSGKRFLSTDFELIKDRNSLIIYKSNNTLAEPRINIIKREKRVNEHFPPTKADKAFFDSKILNKKLTLRHWKDGDCFYPLGMKQSRKLSDFFTDRKLTLKQKHEIWLLMSGDDIAWIVGERIDNRYKVNKQTTHVVEISIE